MRIAMWSGPRNLSTAMMYSFGARTDFAVMDEPFYAAYLARTGLEHPMRDEIISTHETDPNKVDLACRREGKPHLYMKHMPHHMCDDFPMGWSKDCVHVHLIRNPARVIASYAAKREAPTLEDIGFVQQQVIYGQLGGVVVDSTDIRADPETKLRKLCDAIDLAFDPAMLGWSAGPRPEDGVWAKHWYGAVHRSSGFAGAEGDMPKLEPDMEALMEVALPYYESMAAQKI
ncbi:HAD family hydrolase [Sulfitobacter sp. JBTF-M27]|uniref:HAD family hydrolase n=1 Tax=Sulfitobacter sediminilitoris TaxID=2698830 RepID=A0A6P0C5W4_9RHOB|nr:sulfotransferase domain-containing protein [Sulfitobacter sediminilitoris]NEK21559.1 HAD family hydrolase [Sulfitobacter sediminilitoris]